MKMVESLFIVKWQFFNGGDREDENICVARNQGQAKSCPEGSTIVFA
jgi:hypothetical protein